MRKMRGSVALERVPVDAAVAQGGVEHLALERLGDLAFLQAPAPVHADGGGLVHAGLVVKTDVVLNRDDAGIRTGDHDRRHELLVHLAVRGVLVAEIIADALLAALVKTIEPALNRLVVVGAGVGDAVGGVVVGEIVVGGAEIALIKGELEHLHVREAGVADEIAHGLGHEAQIFRDDGALAEVMAHALKEGKARTLLPMAGERGGAAEGNGEILVEAAEMIDAHDVVELKGLPQAGDPPGEIGGLVIIPAVDRVAPDLTVGGEVIGRAAGNFGELAVAVHLEQLRVRPCVRAVGGNVDGHVANELDGVRVGIGLELAPLLEELELHVLLELDVKIQLAAVIIQRKAPVHADVLRPLAPRLLAKEAAHGHEERVIAQPPVILQHEALIILVVDDVAALIGQMQELVAVFMELFKVDVAFGAEIDRLHLFPGEHAFLDQRVKADQIGIAGEGGIRLIGRVAGGAEARGTEGQNLPVGLAGGGEEIDKVIRCLIEAADAVFGGQAGNGEQNARGSFHRGYLTLLMKVDILSHSFHQPSAGPPGNSHSRASAPCDSRRSACLNRPLGAAGFGPSLRRELARRWP